MRSMNDKILGLNGSVGVKSFVEKKIFFLRSFNPPSGKFWCRKVETFENVGVDYEEPKIVEKRPKRSQAFVDLRPLKTPIFLANVAFDLKLHSTFCTSFFLSFHSIVGTISSHNNTSHILHTRSENDSHSASRVFANILATAFEFKYT